MYTLAYQHIHIYRQAYTYLTIYAQQHIDTHTYVAAPTYIHRLIQLTNT